MVDVTSRGETAERSDPRGDYPDLVPVPPPDRALRSKQDTARDARRFAPRQRNWLMAVLTSRRFWFVLALIVVAAASIVIPWYFWYRAPELRLGVAVLDKTVPFKDRREHRGLYWLLRQNKFIDGEETGDPRWYAYDQDYVGFFPVDVSEVEFERVGNGNGNGYAATEAAEVETGEEAAEGAAVAAEPPEEPAADPMVVETASMRAIGNWRTTLLDYETELADRDVLYIADTYGVYTGDYTQFREDWAHTMHTEKIFGGIEELEAEAAERFAAEGKMIIAEFNCFASPTPDDIRARMEHVLGVTWTRWIGRYFLDFSDIKDVPYWLLQLYEEQTGHAWDLTGSGYMLCRDESAEFVILKDGEDVMPRHGLKLIPHPVFMEHDVMQGVKPCTFCYWFDIVEPGPNSEVIASYDFHVTPQGQAKLEEHGLKSYFPAVVRTQQAWAPMPEPEPEPAEEGEEAAEEEAAAAEEEAAEPEPQVPLEPPSGQYYTVYYMAGDMVDFDKAMGPANTRLTMYINRSFYGQPVVGSQGYFFWHTYYPLVTNILRRESFRLTGAPNNVYLFD